MAELKVSIAGVPFENPLIAASGIVGFGREYSELYPLKTLGGISCKGTTLLQRPGNPPPRVTETACGMLNAIGLQNPGVEHFIEEDLPWLKKQETVVIANIAGSTKEEYEEVAAKLDGSGVQMLEVNISCPNVKAGGVQFGTTVQGVSEITNAVRKVTSLPLMIKLSPNVTDIGEIAAAAEAAGADVISMINTLTGMKIDIETRRPVIKNNTAGLSGPAVLPVAVRMIWQAAQRVKIPIVGMGGISCWQDAVEVMLAGASAFQVGTSLFTDPYVPFEILEGLDKYLDRHGLSSVTQLTGGIEVW